MIHNLKRVICPVCHTKQEITLAFPEPSIRGHIADGKTCPGSLKPVEQPMKAEA